MQKRLLGSSVARSSFPEVLCVLAFFAVYASIACSGTSPTTGTPAATCPSGSERCVCYANGTCDQGLTCLSNRCVNAQGDDAGSSSGAGSSSSGGSASGSTSGSSSGGSGSSSASSSSGSASGSSSGGASSGSSSGGATCPNAAIAGGIAFGSGYQADYQGSLGAGGYCYGFADGNMPCTACGASSACVASQSLCGAGTSATYIANGANWGGGVGCELNQAPASSSNPSPVAQRTALTGRGLTYALSGFPQGGDTVYLMVDNGGAEYYCTITTASGTCLWTNFSTTPWAPATNVYLAGVPAAASHVQIQVSSGAVPEAWRFCVTALSIAP